jgi:hypothetical protein
MESEGLAGKMHCNLSNSEEWYSKSSAQPSTQIRE